MPKAQDYQAATTALAEHLTQIEQAQADLAEGIHELNGDPIDEIFGRWQAAQNYIEAAQRCKRLIAATAHLYALLSTKAAFLLAPHKFSEASNAPPSAIH